MTTMKRGVLGTSIQRVNATKRTETEREVMDAMTPSCKFCGEAHVGIHVSTFLMLRGTWVFSPPLGHEVFVLDPDIQVVPMELPNGQQAIAADMNRPEIIAAAHEDCIERILIDVGLEEAEEEEDELDSSEEENEEEDL